MKNNTIVCISRECGCCGREIGQRLASIHNIPFYDKQQVMEAVNKSGIGKEIFEAIDNQNVNSLLFALANKFNGTIGGKYSASGTVSMTDRIFVIINEFIKDIASKGSCVILGRCADDILSDYNNVVKIFIYADLEERTKVVMKRENVNEKTAKKIIKNTDRNRSAYYHYYTGETWGKRDRYDLIINSGLLGVDGTLDIINSFVTKFDDLSTEK
ncbi:MAG: cytidylate kinase-like family protein [Firmicutes bacterium]|nr:cytidylate kinase-like family protein [Bacillota bacterium]